ncbi:unnamed protein product [Protopolystoma xenopodis]|uniref:Uncharacterized protein n=1 Tax=Protopolystoma xenopodis TaxID=117903 RepID=A0A448X2X7_9PLAT|nr:unnamed protein product [Protopolystoma xenopodis]
MTQPGAIDSILQFPERDSHTTDLPDSHKNSVSLDVNFPGNGISDIAQPTLSLTGVHTLLSPTISISSPQFPPQSLSPVLLTPPPPLPSTPPKPATATTATTEQPLSQSMAPQIMEKLPDTSEIMHNSFNLSSVSSSLSTLLPTTLKNPLTNHLPHTISIVSTPSASLLTSSQPQTHSSLSQPPTSLGQSSTGWPGSFQRRSAPGCNLNASISNLSGFRLDASYSRCSAFITSPFISGEDDEVEQQWVDQQLNLEELDSLLGLS